jgi:heme/copper-type cytochrome/quinol oxidase subunit 4
MDIGIWWLAVLIVWLIIAVMVAGSLYVLHQQAKAIDDLFDDVDDDEEGR